jgi:hypothetical protein
MLSLKSIFFFIIIFGAILYAYLYYDQIMSQSYIYYIVRILLVAITMLSIAFPHVMNYLKYSDNENISFNDILLSYHSKK